MMEDEDMKFSCDRSMLQAAVATASRCAAAKSPIPALEGLLIQAGSDVRVTGYDLKKGIYTSIPADVTEPGSIVLSARFLSDIVRSLPAGEVTIYTENGLNTRIQCGDADFTTVASDSADYPELPSVDKERAISVPQGILSRMIRQTVFAVSDNESRPVYTGELFEVKGDELTLVAVDGYRLALRREKVDAKDVEDCSFIVPGATLSDLEKLCGDTDEKVSITVGAKHISFVAGDTVLVSRRLEGEFLNYSRSIPSEFAVEVEADKEELVQAVSRVSIIVDERTKNPLRLKLEDGLLTIWCNTGVSQGKDQCAVKGGKDASLEIGFNNRYLLDALKAAPAEKLDLCFNNASSPCVVLPADGSDGFSYMILPVRLKAGA